MWGRAPFYNMRLRCSSFTQPSSHMAMSSPSSEAAPAAPASAAPPAPAKWIIRRRHVIQAIVIPASMVILVFLGAIILFEKQSSETLTMMTYSYLVVYPCAIAASAGFGALRDLPQKQQDHIFYMHLAAAVPLALGFRHWVRFVRFASLSTEVGTMFEIKQRGNLLDTRLWTALANKGAQEFFCAGLLMMISATGIASFVWATSRERRGWYVALIAIVVLFFTCLQMGERDTYLQVSGPLGPMGVNVPLFPLPGDPSAQLTLAFDAKAIKPRGHVHMKRAQCAIVTHDRCDEPDLPEESGAGDAFLQLESEELVERYLLDASANHPTIEPVTAGLRKQLQRDTVQEHHWPPGQPRSRLATEL